METCFRAFLVFFMACLSGCAAQAPTLQTGPNAEVSFDGLVRVDNARFAGAWVDPQIDLARYTKIMPGGATFEFRASKDLSASAARRSGASQFAISAADKQRLEQEVSAVFREELGRSQRFTVTDEPGFDVLIIEGALLDIVSFVPPEIAGRGEIYLDRVGEATLVLQLVDSMSGQTVARAVERGLAAPAGRMGMQSNTVTTWAEVRRLARRWAVKLREGLDSLAES
jgi:hypothetical protein